MPLFIPLVNNTFHHLNCCAHGDEMLRGAPITYYLFSQWAFLVRDNRILNRPLSRSLRLFAHTAHSAHLFCSAPLRYACSARSARSLHSRARSLTSLTPSWDGWKSWICVHIVNTFHRNKRVFGRHQKHALRSQGCSSVFPPTTRIKKKDAPFYLLIKLT